MKNQTHQYIPNFLKRTSPFKGKPFPANIVSRHYSYVGSQCSVGENLHKVGDMFDSHSKFQPMRIKLEKNCLASD